MAARTPPAPPARPYPPPAKAALRAAHRLRRALRRVHPAWFLSLVLGALLLHAHLRPAALAARDAVSETYDAAAAAAALREDALVRARSAAAVANASLPGGVSRGDGGGGSGGGGDGGGGGGGRLGNHFCVLQPTLSAGKETWGEAEARGHIALRAFMRTFATTVTPGERDSFRFSIYYGHDSDDPVFGEPRLRAAFEDEANRVLQAAGFGEKAVRLVFSPLYGLHGRINAIWNVLAKDAYYDGCDYFFLSNDDMVFFTSGWVSRSRDSLSGIGSPVGHKRPCRYFGIVRFKDEWASWATFTFHVSTRMHLEIFGGVYYPVPYNSAHNDYWINFVYHHFDASKYRGEIRVRNRVDDVDFALAHEKDTTHVAPPRYVYDERGDARKYINEGRARVKAWLDKYRDTDRCLPPL